MFFYAARRYAQQLREGENDVLLKPLVLLVIADFIVLVEVPKWRNTLMQQSQTLLAQWMIFFLKEGSKMQTHKDLLDAPWVTPELKKAVLELERLQADQRVRDLDEARRDKQFLERRLYQ